MIKRSYKSTVYEVEIVDAKKIMKKVEITIAGTKAFRSRKSFAEAFKRHYKEPYLAVIDYHIKNTVKITYGMTDTEFKKHAKLI